MSQSQRGRASRGRATQQQRAASAAQQLPHAQPSTSGGAIRRPGHSATQASAVSNDICYC